MNEADDSASRRVAVESTAAEWLVKHDRGLSPEQQDSFLQWLAASPAHRESFNRHRAMWRDFDALAQWRPEHSSDPNPDLLARPRRARPLRWLAPILLPAAAAVAFVLWWPRPAEPAGAALEFEAESYRQEVLPDGSVVDLNRGAHVLVQFAPPERRVVLVQGEAQFTVAKNPARPFIVRAGGVDVRAVGTAFNVKLAGANLEVLVTEGTVHVAQQAPARVSSGGGAVAPKPPSDVLASLSAGQRTVISVSRAVARPLVLATTSQEVEQLLGWKPRLLDFDSAPLAQVIDAFNRCNATQLVIGDHELHAVPIVASIRSDNVEGFVRMLEATMGIRAERRGEGEIVLRRSR
jgi:transmembrane sensor